MCIGMVFQSKEKLYRIQLEAESIFSLCGIEREKLCWMNTVTMYVIF